MRLADISFEDVTAITDKLVKTRSEQRHALVVGNTFFRWCVRRRFIKHSPLAGVDIPKPKKRKRVLSDDELVKVYRAAEGIGQQGELGCVTVDALAYLSKILGR